MSRSRPYGEWGSLVSLDCLLIQKELVLSSPVLLWLRPGLTYSQNSGHLTAHPKSLMSPVHLGINTCLNRSAYLGSLTQATSPPVCLHCCPSWTSCPLLPVLIALSPEPSMEGHSISDCWINFVAYARNDTTASGSDRYFIIWWGRN